MKENYADIEVMCFHLSNADAETTYYDICRDGIPAMDMDNWDIKSFWMAYGGFTITLDGYKTVFHSGGFYNIVKATTFLLNTIYWLEGKSSGWFNDHEGAEELFINLGLHETFKVRKKNEHEILLSYYRENNAALRNRGEHFFHELLLSRDSWIDACKIALGEYFQMVREIADAHPESKLKRVLDEYYDVWMGVSGININRPV